MTMITKKELKDMLARIQDRDSCISVSPKPFRPKALHVIVSMLAPQYYNEQELAQLKSFSKGVVVRKARTPTRKRRHYQIEEDMPEEETVNEMNKKPKKMTIIMPIVAASPPQDLSDEFMKRIRELNGSDIKFLMHKTLCDTDLSQNNNRLSMPKLKIACEFLTEDEKVKLNEREDSKGRLVGVEVTLLDPYLREYNMPLKKWEMKKDKLEEEKKGIIYNLVTKWNQVVLDNKFKIGQELDIWCFRVDTKLYFLLNKL